MQCSAVGTTIRAFLFQTGWFVESLVIQTLIIHAKDGVELQR